MVIIWGGSLALFLKQIKTNSINGNKRYTSEERFKRIGIYYMCIDDLLN